MVSSFGAGILFKLTGSGSLSGVFFLSGVLIDLDHFWDYFRNEGLKFNFYDFFNKFYRKQYKKYCLPFHSWELVLVLGLCTQIFPGNKILIGGFLGTFQHLFFDQLFNSVKPLGYFFLYRLNYRFKDTHIFRNKE